MQFFRFLLPRPAYPWFKDIKYNLSMSPIPVSPMNPVFRVNLNQGIKISSQTFL